MSKTRQSQQKLKSGKQKRPAPMPKSTLAAESLPVTMLVDGLAQFSSLPDHRSGKMLRQSTILRLQQEQGNTAVQRMLVRSDKRSDKRRKSQTRYIPQSINSNNPLQKEEDPSSSGPAASPAGGGNASVFYVSFQNVAPPGSPDHSQEHPGPDGVTANRAGYTRVRITKRMTISWDTGPGQADGQVPLYARSVNIFYRLDPIEVFVSSLYAEGSCPYRVTLTHERTHVSAFLRIFHAGRATLVEALNEVAVPTVSAPRLVQRDDIESVQDEVGDALASVIRSHSAQLVQEMENDRNAKDSPAAYQAVYSQCPAAEW